MRLAKATPSESSLSAARRHIVSAKNATADQAVGIKTKTNVN